MISDDLFHDIFALNYPNQKYVLRGSIIERWYGPGIKPTQLEIDNVINNYLSKTSTELKVINFTAKSRQKDVLTTCAQIVRARNINNWNNMTIQQKKDATLVEADVWVNIRQFIEDNL